VNKVGIKLAVLGSRIFSDYELLYQELNKFKEIKEIDEIVTGGAVGADLLAICYAGNNDITYKVIKPNWKKHGKSAGYVRNREIWEYVDGGIIFWDGKSKGTAHSIKLAKEFNKFLKIVRF